MIKEALILGINLKNQDIDVKEMARRNARQQVASMRSKSQNTSLYGAGTFGNKMRVANDNAYDIAENETSLNDVNPKTESSAHIQSLDKLGLAEE